MKSFFLSGFFIAVSILTFNLKLSAECGLNDPIITNVNCKENATYQFDVNFAISDPDLDSFDIYINEIFYGSFSILDLPVTVLQNKFSGKKFDVLKISDPDRENCFVIQEIENPCSCAIFDFKYAIKKCTDTTFNIVMDFKNFETSDSFDVGMIGQYFGTYSYKKLPITIGPFENKDTSYTLNVVDKQDFFCFSDFKVNAGDCPDCSIRDISLNSWECEGNNKIYLKLSFLHTNVMSNKYVIKTNTGNLVTGEYKNNVIVDSVTFKEVFVLGPVDLKCESQLQINIWDQENKSCQDSIIIDSLCCDQNCEIGEIALKELNCTSDSTYQFYLKFNYFNNESDTFFLNVNNQISGYYHVNQLPLKVEVALTDDGPNDFIKICMDNSECCKGLEYKVPDCNEEFCVIENVTWKAIFDTLTGKYWIKLDFDYANASETFTVKGNGIDYGIFKYSNLPIILGSYKCKDELNLEYVIRDTKYELCKIVVEPGVIKCPTSAVADFNSDRDWMIYKGMNENYVEVISDSQITKNATIEIINIIGEKINITKIEDGRTDFRIDIPKVPEGIYIVRFRNSDSIYSRKILVSSR